MFKSIMEMTEKRICEFEARSIESSLNNREKNIDFKNSQSLRNMRDKNKRSRICYLSLRRRGCSTQCRKKYLKK